MKLPHWLRSRAALRNGTPPRPARSRARLAVEQLEDRLTPSVSLGSGTLTSYADLTGDPNTPYVYGWALDEVADHSGNRYVLGYSQTADNTASVNHVHKLNPDNSLAWVTTISNSPTSGGGTLALDVSGNVYAGLGGSGSIVRLDPNGVQQPARYQAPGQIADLATDPAGAVYYTSTFTTVRLEWRDSGPVKVNEYAIGADALAVSPDGSQVYLTGTFGGGSADFDPTHSYSDNRDILATRRLSAGRWDWQVYVLNLTWNAGTEALTFRWVGQVGGSSNERGGRSSRTRPGFTSPGPTRTAAATPTTTSTPAPPGCTACRGRSPARR